MKSFSKFDIRTNYTLVTRIKVVWTVSDSLMIDCDIYTGIFGNIQWQIVIPIQEYLVISDRLNSQDWNLAFNFFSKFGIGTNYALATRIKVVWAVSDSSMIDSDIQIYLYRHVWQYQSKQSGLKFDFLVFLVNLVFVLIIRLLQG